METHSAILVCILILSDLESVVRVQSSSILVGGTMAQGKAFTEEERSDIIQSLKPFLEAGLSRNKACEYIGLPPQTLSNWVQDDERLGIILRGWENANNILALNNITDALRKEAEMDDARKETSKWWAERRMKKEFSTRVEQTGEDGAPLVVTFDRSFNESTTTSKEDSE